jgi:hypothetical protein
MKARLRRKTFSLIASLGLLLGMLPASAWAEPSGNGEVIAIENGGFEQVVDGKPAGWTAWGNSVFESVYEPVLSGSYSVKLTDASAQSGNGIRSSPVTVVPGHYYRAAVYGLNETGTSQMYVEFWNAADQRIDVKIANISSVGRWDNANIVAIAPQNAAYATILLYQHVSNVGVAYFDDAEFEETTDDLPYNAGFERVSGDKPVGWTSLGSGFEYAADSSVVYSGSYSLKMVDPSADIGTGLRSASIPVVPDQLYQASVYSYNESGVSQLYVEYWNSANVRIDVKIATNSTVGEWSKMTIDSYAPAGAAYATLLMYLHKDNVGTAYFDEASFRLVPPEPVREFPLVVAGHPRLYFTADDLPALRERAADTTHAPFGQTGKQLWDTVQRAADAYLTETSFSITYDKGVVVTYPLPPVQPGPIASPPGYTTYPYWTMMTRQIQDRLETLSLAYAVTGNTDYADKAKQYMLSLVGWDAWTDPNYPCGGFTCLDTAHLTFGVSMAFDILYDRLTEAERARVMNALETKGLIPLYKDVLSKIDHNIQSLRAAALGSGAAVLLGHSPNANAYLTRAMNYYRWYLDERMHSGKQEGMLYTSYAMDNMIKAFDHIDRVTGVRELAEHPFLNDFLVRWVVYALAPGGAGLANFSDSGVANYFGLTMNVINAWLNNGQAGWYLRETGAAAGGVDGFLYFRPNAVITPPDESWPASAVLDENGWAMLRSGWGTKDVLFAMVANNSNLGHNHYDQNSFQIATNRTWIAGDPGYQDYVAGPAHDFTVRLGHSTIRVDGKGQSVLGNGTITGRLLAPTYDYVKGSAAGAYGDPKLNKFDRHVVYLKPDTFVMLDAMQADEPHVYEWILYSGNLAEFEIDGQAAQPGETIAGHHLYMRRGGAQLAAKFLSETPLPITVTTYPGADSYGYYAKVGSGNATSDYRFLTVMRAKPYEETGFFDETNLLPLTDSSGNEVKLVQANGVTVIFYRGLQAGDYMTVTVDVPETGNYKMTSQFLKSPLYGMVQAYIDGQPAGGVYDGYAPAVEGPFAFDHGYVSLTAGTHTIRYEVVGKNAQSGNYFIGLDELRLTPEGWEELRKLAVDAELVQGTGGVGALVARDDEPGIRDVAVFRTGAQPFDVGGMTGDAEQAVVSLNGEDEAVGYKMADGTWLRYDGNVLLSGNAPFGAAFDTDSETAEISGIVETSTTQPIRIRAPANGFVVLDGNPLHPGGYHVDEQEGTIELAMTVGRHEVNVICPDAMIERMIEAGELRGPMAQPLLNAMRQAQHHWRKGSADKAADHLRRGQDHLNNPNLQKFVTESAKTKINETIERILALL